MSRRVEEEEAFSFVSEMGPPPLMSRFPTPFNFPNKPVSMVPDVSLIMGNERQLGSTTLSSSTPILSRSATRLTTTVTPIPYYPYKSETFDPDLFCRELKIVKDAIRRMEVKTDKLLEYQRDLHAYVETSLCRNIKMKDLPPAPRRADEVHFGPIGDYSYCEPSSIKSLPLESFHSGDTTTSTLYSHQRDHKAKAPRGGSTTFYNDVLGNINRLLDEKPQKEKSSRKHKRQLY